MLYSNYFSFSSSCVHLKIVWSWVYWFPFWLL